MAFGTRNFFLAATFVFALAGPVSAQDNAAPATPTTENTASAPTANETAAPTPEAAGPEIIETPEGAKAHISFDPKAATDAYLATVKGEARAKSDAYFEGGYVLQAVDTLYALIVAAILLWTKISARIRNWAQRITRMRWLQVPIYAIAYFVLAALLTFPLTAYEQFYREHQYGLSNQDFMGWFTDFIKLFGVSTLIFIVFVTILYAFMRWTRDRWWLWGTAIAVLFIAFTSMIAPVYVAPLINDYKPLAEGQIKSDILSMARANGVPADNVWEFNASKQSKRISANVSGLLDTTRVSLNDNLLNRSTPAEIRAVMGHELGHYVLGHTYTFLSWALIIAFIAFGFTNWAFKRLTGAYGNRWDVRGIDDPAGMPLVFALIGFLLFVGTPVLNTMVRSVEAQADIFGLNAAREPDGFATVTLKLSEYRKLDPTPLEEFVYYDHPSGRSRISMAMQWKAEHLNEQNR